MRISDWSSDVCSSDLDERWRFWFLEALVWILLGTAVLFKIGWVRRAEAARPFAFALGVFVAAMVVRLAATGWTADGVDRYTPPVVIWCVALGWLAARATTPPRRILVSVIGFLAILDFFGEPNRKSVV